MLASEFEPFFRRYVVTVARWAQRLGGPGFDADDAVQDVFLIAHRRLNDVSSPMGVRAFLYRATAHVVRKRRARERFRQMLGAMPGLAERMLSPRPSPAQALEDRETSNAVYRVLDQLPEKYRGVLILFEMEGLSGVEIANLTGVRVETVWVQLHRARALFLEKMLAASPQVELPGRRGGRVEVPARG